MFENYKRQRLYSRLKQERLEQNKIAWTEAPLKRKQRMAKTGGKDLRFIYSGNPKLSEGPALCDENMHIYRGIVLVNCTDLDNPYEYFTGVLLKPSSGIYLCYVGEVGENRDVKPYSLVKDIKGEFCPDYHDYQRSRLTEIDNLAQLGQLFPECANTEGLIVQRNKFRAWADSVYSQYIINHNVDDAATKAGQKILQYGKQKGTNK